VQRLPGLDLDGAAAGGAPVQLTAPTFDSATPFDESPSWSPDGKQILLERSGLDGTKSTLVTIAPTGGAAKDLGVIGRAPVWGPKLVAFIDAVNPKATIKSLDPATGAVHTVATAGTHDVSSLAWSADGRLAFLDFDPTGHASIVVVGSSTRPVRLAGLLPPSSLVGGLAWSPDGARFAFSATDANGVGEIYTIRADGTGLARVTNDAGAVGGISWR
jgi:Tol biopolymer transport system component